jgi:superfamily II DNA or RNA helicase
MSDRLLTSKKRRLLLYRKYDGRCSSCGNDLPDDWHADHIIPHSKGGSTELSNMQPLCPSCNLQKSDSMPASDTRNQRTLSQQKSLLNWDAFRPGQEEAVGTATHKFQTGSQWVSIVLPTRYGKTDVARCVSYSLWKKGRIDAVLMLEPSRPIVEQTCDLDEWKETVQRYGIPGHEVSIRELRSRTDLQKIRPNNEWFLGITTQLFDGAYRLGLQNWVQSNNVLLVVDECHTTSESNEWGSTVQEFADDGGIVMSMTATANRSDNEGIPGFENRFLKEDEGTQAVASSADKEDKILVEVYNSVRGQHQIIPDHKTTFQQAWDEGVLCDVSHSTFDVELEPLTDSGSTEHDYLSDLPKSVADAHLGSIVREQPVVKKGVERLLENQMSWIEHQPEVQSIVFCANDRPGQSSDYHAQMIRREIEKKTSDLDVVKATNKADREVQRVLREFSDGAHDVLISKMAAGVGMDYPNAKILLDLSPVRTFNSWVQRVMRIATKVEWAKTSFLITPEDIKSLALYEMLVREKGGASTLDDPHDLLSTTRLEEKVDQYEVKKEEGDKDGFIADGTRNGSFQDNNQNRAERDMWEPSRDLIEGLGLHGQLTEAEVATTLSENGLRVTKKTDETKESDRISEQNQDGSGLQNTTRKGESMKSRIKDLVGLSEKSEREDDCLIKLWIDEHHGGDYRAWLEGEAPRNVWSEVRNRADSKLTPDAPSALNDIDNLKNLKEIKKTVIQMRNEYMRRS